MEVSGTDGQANIRWYQHGVRHWFILQCCRKGRDLRPNIIKVPCTSLQPCFNPFDKIEFVKITIIVWLIGFFWQEMVLHGNSFNLIKFIHNTFILPRAQLPSGWESWLSEAFFFGEMSLCRTGDRAIPRVRPVQSLSNTWGKATIPTIDLFLLILWVMFDINLRCF